MNLETVMTEEEKREQEKVKKFFGKLLDNSVKKVASWALIWIFLFILMIMCMVPAQEIYSETDGSSLLIPGVMAMLSFWTAAIRTYTYEHYADNQNARLMMDILKYHPVRMVDIRRYKMSVFLMFMGKVLVTALVLQVVITLIALRTLSIENFVHIFINIFLFPVAGEFLFDVIVGKLTKE